MIINKNDRNFSLFFAATFIWIGLDKGFSYLMYWTLMLTCLISNFLFIRLFDEPKWRTKIIMPAIILLTIGTNLAFAFLAPIPAALFGLWLPGIAFYIVGAIGRKK
jgi:hypothetical protein